ncbi:hypothetical protein [Cytophaga hutchinsonii]|uniref:Uncharacterized protein n=1 Tax=Cytophaga hutchinsonii (strain ATCC 33406 / DSM 1761 / CIP 103989 / NBRC 15051 / NCIMB 9469 / D465) TaxID=269798 RepID=A0A6N4SQ28_CYTH3|nr:hypothetical protein [Cytophaga hutchinsonii]ABG58447.1 hypothetical protein CHU_1172 [Cytophaga hutchinsonii ATCC 33406]SFX74629.1 hypothetical protein SAMN04487930_10913 [Cytophaga hutchinsonii ATCC 33406]
MANKAKSEILERFKKQKSKPNHVIDQGVISHAIFPKLNPKEQDSFNDTLKEMYDEGLILTEQRTGAFCIVLTEKGYDTIYPINEKDAIEKIGKSIMNRFLDTNSRVGHIIDNRWLNYGLTEDLNPKEIDLIDKSISNLIKKEFIVASQNGISLAQKGFDNIY